MFEEMNLTKIKNAIISDLSKGIKNNRNGKIKLTNNYRISM